MNAEQHIEQIFREALSIEPPPSDTDLIAAGLLDSLSVVTLLVELEDRFGVTVRLEDIDLDSLRTLKRLANLVERASAQSRDIPAEASGSDDSPLVLLREGISERPLYIVHTVEGGMAMLRPLAMGLDTSRAIYGLQARGLDPSEEPRRSVEEMAEAYTAAIRSFQPEGPFAVCGYSFGGLVAFEIACRLAAAGERLDLLALVDPEAHPAALAPLARWRFWLVRPFRHIRYLAADPRGRIPLYAKRTALHAFPKLPIELPPSGQPVAAQYQRVKQAADAAARVYRPKPYDGSATLFLARTRAPGACSPRDVWSEKVRGLLTVTRVPGRHHQLLARDNIGPLTEALSRTLDESRSAEGMLMAEHPA